MVRRSEEAKAVPNETNTGNRPAYKDLPDGNARGVFGVDDELGCLNLLTPARTAAAASLIQSGKAFALDVPVNSPTYNNPGFFSAQTESERGIPHHTILKLDDVIRDDYLDGFYPQHNTQWDHFLHCGDQRTKTFYNDLTDDSAGIVAWATRGIVGRAVLLDVARWAEAQGNPIDWRSSRAISADDLEATAGSQGVEIEEGTVVLLRLGWETGYKRMNERERIAYAKSELATPGLEPSPKVAERLWDWGVAAIAADNPAMEVWPFRQDGYLLHYDLLGCLGIPIGEFWLLDALAEQCAAERRYEVFFTSAPLGVHGGVGSPGNALAIL
jgi:kynurenine formamidase